MFFKHILFKNFLKLHYYFVFLSFDENHESTYLSVTYFIEKVIQNITLFPFHLLKPFIRENQPELHTSLTFKILAKSNAMAPYWGLFFLIFFSVYDLFYNKLILQNIFYIIPWVCFYQLLLIIKDFLYKAHCFEKDIACFLYGNIRLADNEMIYYDNNFETDKERFTLFTDYISRGYKPILQEYNK